MRHDTHLPFSVMARPTKFSIHILSGHLLRKWYGSPLALAALITLLSSGCSLAPQTMPMDARSLGNGIMALGAEAIPTQSVRIRRGVSERLELGLQLEPVMITGFGKLTVLQTPSFAAALYAAGTYGPDGNYSARSFQVGPLPAVPGQ